MFGAIHGVDFSGAKLAGLEDSTHRYTPERL